VRNENCSGVHSRVEKFQGIQSAPVKIDIKMNERKATILDGGRRLGKNSLMKLDWQALQIIPDIF
jgi:hypothetical protein